MRMFTALIVGFCLILNSSATFAGRENGETQRDEGEDVRIKRILDRDIIAIVDAGRSGNKAFVPALKKVVGGKEYRLLIDETPVEQARLALARLGDPEALMDYWCGAIAEEPTPLVTALRPIGGWFAFQAALKIFDGVGQAEFVRAVRKAEATDITYRSPASLALEVLPTVATNPPVGVPEYPADIPKYIEIWREWIRVHETELRTLEPTGVGVEFSSEACRSRNPRKKGR